MIKELRERFGDGWWIILDSDLARANPAGSPGLADIDPRAAEDQQVYRARQAPKEAAFGLLAHWLHLLNPDLPIPSTSPDWRAVAEIHFWGSQLEGVDAVVRSIRDLDLQPAVTELPLPVLAELVLSLSMAADDDFRHHLRRHQPILLDRFRREMNSPLVEEDGDILRAHYIIDLDVFDPDNPSKSPLHDRTIEQAALLRRLAPGWDRYGARGYGHHQDLVPWVHDPADVEGVLTKYLAPPWAPSTNRIFINLADLETRPADWREYAHEVVRIREEAVISLERLQRALEAHFRSERALRLLGTYLDGEAWVRVMRLVERGSKLPRSAVDEWGFSAEGAAKPDIPADEPEMSAARSAPARAQRVAGDRYAAHREVQQSFLRPLANFFNQARHPLATNSYVGRARNAEDRARIENIAQEGGVRLDLGFLSSYNLWEARRHLPHFQREFREHFGELVGARRLERLERRERQVYGRIWPIWYHFAEHPERRWRVPVIGAARQVEEVHSRIRRDLEDRLSALGSDRLRASVVRDDVPFDGDPAIWIGLDVEDLEAIDTGLESVTDVLASVLAPVSYRSLEQLVVEDEWSRIIVLQTVKGVAPFRLVFPILPARFFEGGGGELALPTLLPQPADPDTFASLGVEVVEGRLLEQLERIHEALADLWQRTAHLADLARMPEVDEVGAEILGAYVNTESGPLRRSVERAMSAWTVAMEGVLAEGGGEGDRFWAALHDEVLDLREVLVSPGGERIPLSDLPEWSRRLQDALARVATLRLIQGSALVGARIPSE